MKQRAGLIALAILVAGAVSLLAQSEAEIRSNVGKLKPKDFPTQPIEFTVVYPPGGAMDQNARILAKYAEKWSGQKIIVNNRTGGAGMVGHYWLAAQAKNDGYVIGVVANLMISDSLLRARGKWSYADLEPIAYLNNDPLNIVASTSGIFKGKTLKQIVQTAKDRPNTVRMGILPGGMFEYLAEDIEQATGAKFLKVPFQGGAAGLTALLGDNIDVTAAFFSEYRGYLDAGKIAPVAVAGPQRMAFLKDVPTCNEALGVQAISWRAERYVVAPKGIPADRKAYLAAVLNAAIRDPQFATEFAKLGLSVDTSMNSPQQVAAYVEILARKEREFYQRTGRLK